MSNGWSIDGLKRKPSNSRARSQATKSNTMVGRTGNKQVAARKSTTMQARKSIKVATEGSRITTTRKTAAKPTVSAKRSVGIPDSKKELKALEKKSKSIEVIDDAAETAAIKDFLDESKDINPTDLVDLPQKDNKTFKKEAKRLKKDAKKANKQNKKKKSHIGRNIFLFFLLLLIGGGVYLYFYLDSFVADITDDGSIIGLIFADDNVKLEKDENGRTNILVFGTEGYDMNDPNYDGGYLTDSMMMLSINQETGDIKAVNLPRDLNYPTCTATRKLNEVYWCSFSQNDGTPESIKQYENEGGQALEAAFEEVLGQEIHYRVHVNWQAMIQVIDAIGGIDVVFLYDEQTWDGPETTIYTTDPRGLADGWGAQLHYNYPNGEVVHLTGEWALAVARTRNAYGGWGAVGGNFSREYFQQRIIQAMIAKVRNTNFTSDLSAVLGIKSAVGDNLRTNFKDTEIKTLMKLADKIDMGGLQSLSLYENSDDGLSQALLTTGSINGISYVLPYAGAGQYYNIHNFITRAVNSDSFVGESADIVVLNGTSAYGVAASEKINLEDEGFTVSEVGNAEEPHNNFDGVKIYQLNNENPRTVSALAQFYGVDPSTEVPEDLKEYEADFIVIIGNGFKHAE